MSGYWDLHSGSGNRIKIYLAERTNRIFEARGARRISETIRELRSNDEDYFNSPALREAKK